MSQIKQIIKKMRAFAAQDGWSPSKLSCAIGRSQNALRKLYDEDFNPEASTLSEFEKLLKKHSTRK